MFRKLREALKKQRYRVHSDDVALPEVHTGQIAHSDAPETPEKHKSINYENVAIPEVHIPKKKPHQSPSVTASPDGEAFLYSKTPLTIRSGAFCP